MTLPVPGLKVYLFVFRDCAPASSPDGHVKEASLKKHRKGVRKGVRWAALADEYTKGPSGEWQATGEKMIVVAALDPTDAELAWLSTQNSSAYLPSKYYQDGSDVTPLVGHDGLP